jgi:nitrous oxidase accessory protein NosD
MRMIGVLAVALVLLAAPPAAEAYDRLVSPFQTCSLNGPPVHDTLQEAVDAATPGDHIGVCPGTHVVASQVNIDKAVTITGLGIVVVEASSPTVSCLDAVADDVTIRYLTIRHCFTDNDHGVFITGSVAGSTVKNNTMRCEVGGGDTGVFLNAATGASVTKNSLNACHLGIGATSSSDLTISFNAVSFGDQGFSLSNMGNNNQVPRNIVARNSFEDCTWDGGGGVTFSKNTCGTKSPFEGAWD